MAGELRISLVKGLCLLIHISTTTPSGGCESLGKSVTPFSGTRGVLTSLCSGVCVCSHACVCVCVGVGVCVLTVGE